MINMISHDSCSRKNETKEEKLQLIMLSICNIQRSLPYTASR